MDETNGLLWKQKYHFENNSSSAPRGTLLHEIWVTPLLRRSLELLSESADMGARATIQGRVHEKLG